MPKLRQIKTLIREIVFVKFDLLRNHLGLKHGDAAQKGLKQPREESGPQKPADPSTATVPEVTTPLQLLRPGLPQLFGKQASNCEAFGTGTILC